MTINSTAAIVALKLPVWASGPGRRLLPDVRRHGVATANVIYSAN